MVAIRHSRTRGVVIGAAWFVAGASFAALVWWAVGIVTSPAEDPLEASALTLVEVVPGEVGASSRLNTAAEWTLSSLGANRAAGTVTSVNVAPGTAVSQGSLLYAVDLHPVVIATGDVPAFRDIGNGTSGDDVRQLQRLLTDLGFYRGEIMGEAGAVTASAIRAWQKSLGAEQTGIVSVGDIIFVPSLPTRVMLDASLVFRGAVLVGGERVLSGLPASPEFTVTVTDAQAATMPAGTRAEITSPDGAIWTAFVREQRRDAETATTALVLAGADDTAICGETCDQVPVAGPVTLPILIVTVETVSGLVVPSSALVSGADGQVAVINAAGKRLPVTVSAAARGMSVVEGVELGVKVRVPGDAGR